MPNFRATIDSIIATHPARKPYLDITSESLPLSEIFSNEHLDKYKQLELKSLYFRVDKLQFSDELAGYITQASQSGMKEILIMCHENSQLTKEHFYAFLEEHKITINLQIVTSTDQDLSAIRRGGLSMLNDKKSDEIIQDNYNEILDQRFGEFSYTPPKYTEQSEAYPTDVNSKPSLSHEVQVQASTNTESSTESEATIDQAQLNDCMPTRNGFISKYFDFGIRDSFLSSFPEIAIYIPLYDFQIYTDQQVNCVSREAFNWITRNYYTYHPSDDYEIRSDNPPLGLNFNNKHGAILLSEQRTQPINDLSVRRNPLLLKATVPVSYSWLSYVGASPYNPPYGFHRLRQCESKAIEGIFTGLQFCKLSPTTTAKLKTIWEQLQVRGLDKWFVNILLSRNWNQNYYVEANSLLDDDWQAFFDKLFTKILPSTDENDHKLNFFKCIAQKRLYHRPTTIDDMFEGLNGAYEQFKALLLQDHIQEGSDAFNEVFEKFQKLLMEKLEHHHKTPQWKAFFIDLIKTFKTISQNGGSMEEAFTYMEKINIFNIRSVTNKMEQYNLGTPHEYLSDNEKDDKTLTTSQVTLSNTADSLKEFNQALIFLSYIPAFARASIDSWTAYFAGFIADFKADKNCLLSNKYNSAQYFIKKYIPDGITKEGRSISDLQAKLDSIEYDKHYCSPPISIFNVQDNLVEGFSNPELNLPLLTVAMTRSSGYYYDSNHPTQDVKDFITILSVLFSKIKTKDSIEIGKCEYKALYNYNYGLFEVKTSCYPIPHSNAAHEAAVARFLDIARENPELSSGEVMLLGIMSNINEEKGKQALQYVLTLHQQYKKHLYHAMRVAFLKSDTTEGLNEEALEKHILNLFDYLEFLSKTHQTITKNGHHPENLMLFAAAFSNYATLKESDVVRFHREIVPQINEADIKLLHTLPLVNGHAFLTPFDNIKDLHNLFGEISKKYTEEVSHQTRFNYVDRKEANPIDLTELETKYKITFKFSGQRYFQIRNDIANKGLVESVEILDGSTITKGLLAGTSVKKSEIFSKIPQTVEKADFIQELSEKLLSVFTKEGHESFHRDFISIAFNPELPLDKQLDDLEFSKNLFEQDILGRCEHSACMALVETLKAAHILPQFVRAIFSYFKALQVDELPKSGLSLLEFLHIVPTQMYHNPHLFKIVTRFGIQNKMNLKDLYSSVAPFASVDGIERFMEKMLARAEETKDLGIIEILKFIDTTAKDAAQKFGWIMQLTINEMESLLKNPHANLSQVLKIRSIAKITIFKDIAVKFKTTLTEEHYNKLISFLHTHSLNDARLMESYLRSKISPTEVFANLDSLNTLTWPAHTDKFRYDSSKVKSELKKVKNLKTGEYLSKAKQAQLFAEYQSVMKQAEEIYSRYDYNQLRQESLALREQRKLLDGGNFDALHEVNLKFASLITEVFYRETDRFPRYNQVLAVLMTMLPEFDGNATLELASGEGKSAVFSPEQMAYFWLVGSKVDVLTSNEVLATRDLYSFIPFMKALGIKHAREILTVQTDPDSYSDAEVVYSTPSNKALFMSQLRFNSRFSSNEEKAKLFSLNFGMQAIIDEVDDFWKSPVTFNLAAPLFTMKIEDLRILLRFGIKFSEAPLPQNPTNLRLFLIDQINKAKIKFPASTKYLEQLKKDNEELYSLHQALVEIDQRGTQTFNMLFDALKVAQDLVPKLDSEFTVQKNKDNPKECVVIPVINSIPQQGVIFGNIVHQMIEELVRNSQGCETFPNTMPTAVISLTSAKSFVDYYKQTGRGVLGLTATPGDQNELDEFCKINHICSIFSVPRYNQDNRMVNPQQTVTFEQIVEKTVSLASSDSRPVFVYLSDIREAKIFHNKLKEKLSIKEPILCIGTEEDPATCHTIEKSAGEDNAVTVTTLMFGRGMDATVLHPQGGILINACTDCTDSEDRQINIRVGRNGVPGDIYQFCNADILGKQDCNEHKREISRTRQIERLKEQPLIDILSYPYWPAKQEKEQISFNLLIEKKWQVITQETQVTPENSESLRDKLVTTIASLPECVSHIDGLRLYLQQIGKRPEILTPVIDKAEVTAQTPLPFFAYLYKASVDFVSRITNGVQDLAESAEQLPAESFIPYHLDKTYDANPSLARNVALGRIKISSEGSYLKFLQLHYATMAVHILPHRIDPKFNFEGDEFEAEGSGGSKMTEEFKTAVSNFCTVKAQDGTKLAAICQDAVNIEPVQGFKIKPDAFSAITIITKVTSEANHAESLLIHFNQGILLWVNGEDGGIKAFKFKPSTTLEDCEKILEELQEPQSQVDTRKKIWSLLERPSVTDENQEPDHVIFPMIKQPAGNCGWVQVEGTIKAISFAQSFDLSGNIFADHVIESPSWQAALKFSEYVYSTFRSFNQAAFLEKLVCLSDKSECRATLLSEQEKDEIALQINAAGKTEIVSQELKERVATVATQMCAEHKDSLYENSICDAAKSLSVLAALGSEMGKKLQETTTQEQAKDLLEGCYIRGNIDDLFVHYKDWFLHSTDSLTWKQAVKFICAGEVPFSPA